VQHPGYAAASNCRFSRTDQETQGVFIRSKRRAVWLSSTLWLLAIATLSPACLSANTLSSDTELSTEGYFVLSWELSDPNTEIVLQQSSNASFSGAQSKVLQESGAITLTGLADGEYYFRLLQDGAPIDNPVVVTVAHHSLERALGFFFTGCVLFIILLIAIVNGDKSSRGRDGNG